MFYHDLTQIYDGVRQQHNIMAIVGNGFDIQALFALGAGSDTRYESFVRYLKENDFDPTNFILEEMERQRSAGTKDWSDIEQAIARLIDQRRLSEDQVLQALRRIQKAFSRFLNMVVTPEILGQLGHEASSGKLTVASFAEFLGDIHDEDHYARMNFWTTVNIGDAFNYLFVNLNYTTLLDDYLHLDRDQFNPHPFASSDRNFRFRPNPRGFRCSTERQDFRMVAYLHTNVVHPHGSQYIPRSLLFGVDSTSTRSNALSKPYWAQSDARYKLAISDTNLFVVFGSSIGSSDGWWWREIANRVTSSDGAELIIYWRRADGDIRAEFDISQHFAAAAGMESDQDRVQRLISRTLVIIYSDDTPRAFLNTNPALAPSW